MNAKEASSFVYIIFKQIIQAEYKLIAMFAKHLIFSTEQGIV